LQNVQSLQEELAPKVEIVEASRDYGRFHVGPLPSGFGVTLGNALRRVLLSSLEGAAVTAIRVDGVYHEFSAIPGVREDTIDLLLNVKQIRLRSYTDQPVTCRIEAQGPGVVTAADIQCPADVEIVNPELHLATLDGPESRLEMELTVERGTGYRPAEGRETSLIGVIPVDAIFTPIRRVNYTTEHVRVGARTDLDLLVMDIWTDGTISPHDALVQAAQVLIQHLNIFGKRAAPPRRAEKPTLGAGAVVPPYYRDMPIEQLGLSSRTYNCLKRSQITKVGQILDMSKDELLSLRNFGEKSLQEVREKLAELGIIQAEEEQGSEEWVAHDGAGAEAHEDGVGAALGDQPDDE